ncbi:MAG: PKD domain-containing protein [Flavobacteriales bacterium]|nr:PKD domain-containing protein [Flavobacteriales bacterium]
MKRVRETFYVIWSFLNGLIICLAHISGASATHIIGGEIYYACLGNNKYLITLKVYRDCYGGQAPYDNPAHVGIYEGNLLVEDLELIFPGSAVLPFVYSSPCFQAPPNICVEEAVYQGIVELPPSSSGFTLVYQRCCRNHTIVNLVNPGDQGASYIETIPPSSQAVCNSSPYFEFFPPTVLCVGDTLLFPHHAIDPDGDSLVYELCATFQGGTTANPMPVPPDPPPYPPLIFAAPYSPTFPMPGAPPITLHPHTGLLRVTPTQVGQFVVGVCALEYRNGQLIGTHRRDFQFNVAQCSTYVEAQIGFTLSLPQDGSGAYVSCGNFEVQFESQSVNASFFLWDFGLPGNADQATTAQPAFTYPAAGTYEVTLVANPGYFCADTDNVTLIVREPIAPYFDSPPPQCLDNNAFFLQAQGNFSANAMYQWNFGPQATPSSATGPQAGPVHYSTWGTFPVTLSVTDFECTESHTDSLTVIGPMALEVAVDSARGCAPLTVTLSNTASTSNVPVLYTWYSGLAGLSSHAPQPVFTYPSAGVYDVTVHLVDTTGCNATLSVTLPDLIIVYPRPEAAFTFAPDSVSVFLAHIQFTDASSGASWIFYDFGDGTTSHEPNPLHEYMDGGRYPVFQVAGTDYGCVDTAFAWVTILPEYALYVPNAFTPNDNGINEWFFVKGVGIEEIDISIWNRWGECLFHTTQKEEGWNGRPFNSGPLCKQDMYVVLVKVKDVFGHFHTHYYPLHLIR